MEIQENSLFINNSLAQSSVDWNVIQQRIIDKSFFKDTTRTRLAQSLSDMDLIETHFNKIDEIFSDFDHFLLMRDRLAASVASDFSIKSIFSNEQNINQQDLHSIHQIYRFLEYFKDHTKDLGGHSVEKELIDRIQDFRLVVSKDGEINYSGHPRFRSIMNEIQACEQEARIKVRNIISKLSSQGLLQHDQHDIINDRYVVAMKSDTYRADQGRIISRSARFKTLYIEPPAMRELSDQRLLLLSRLQEQIYFFERDNIDCLIKFRPIVLIAIDEIFDFDFFFSKAFYSRTNSLTRPELCLEKEIIARDLFHPLLDKPVKNSFKLDQEVDNLVISGPNTGGKSVFMKAIALSYLFVSKGLFTPSAFSRLFWPEHIFYIGNLNENIEMGLSSFSGEVQALLSIIEQTQHSTCLLFADEIFNSTSSEEASAIACAILDQIKDSSQSICFVSTHHTSLKRIAQDKENYEVCHFGFDEVQNKPNYSLQWGESGNSRAISVLKNSLSPFVDKIVDRIANFMDHSYVEYEKLQAELKTKMTEVEKEQSYIEKLKKQLSTKLARAESEVALFKEREVKRTEQQMQSVIAKANKLVKEIKGGSKTKLKDIYQLKREIIHDVPDKIQDKVRDKKLATVEDLKVGHSYFSSFANSMVEVKAINERKKQVQVSVGNKMLWQKIGDLYIDNNISPSYSKKQAPVEQRAIVDAKDTPIEHDCRGMRLEEFQKYYEDIIQSLFTDDIPYISIIHGHGTGALKNWLRKHLEKDRALDFEVPDGNDGSTTIKLA